MDKSQMPASPPPPGVTPNFENPSGSEYEIYSVSIAMCATATLFLTARLYTRGVILGALGLDDWLCVGAQLCAWAFAILSICNIKNGYGVHIWNLHVDKVINFKKVDLGEENVYALGVWFVKTAILVLYLRLSPEKRFRQITYSIMIFVALYSIVSVFLFTIGCIPVAAMWDITLMDHARCFSQLNFVYSNAACNIVSDLATLILPIKLCWTLQTTLRKKILLLGLFAMGSFACVVAIVRVVTMLPFGNSNDFTWYKVTIAKWCMVEINVGILCASLPAMRPLLGKVFPRVFSSTDQRSGDRGPTGDSYPMKSSQKKGNRRWDHLTGVDTEWTALDPEDGEAASTRAILKTPDTEEHKPAIFKSTDITVTYNEQ